MVIVDIETGDYKVDENGLRAADGQGKISNVSAIAFVH